MPQNLRTLEDDSLAEDFFPHYWTPHRPLACNEKAGSYKRYSREKALGMVYIETHPTCLQNMIVTDVDTHDIRDLARHVGLPEPTWIVGKRGEIVTGHIGYSLHTAVCLTDAARRRPVNLLARVETGICDVLGGDVTYAGRIMKNPLSPAADHFSEFAEESPRYGLKELAAALDHIGALPAYDDPRPRQASGIGRNVDLFDRTRTWSYRAVKRYWSDGYELWAEIVHDRAAIYNDQFLTEGREPLPANEVMHLSRSIAHWVWNRFTEKTFQEIQTHRGHKGGVASGAARRGSKRDDAMQLIKQGMIGDHR